MKRIIVTFILMIGMISFIVSPVMAAQNQLIGTMNNVGAVPLSDDEMSEVRGGLGPVAWGFIFLGLGFVGNVAYDVIKGYVTKDEMADAEQTTENIYYAMKEGCEYEGSIGDSDFQVIPSGNMSYLYMDGSLEDSMRSNPKFVCPN